MFISEQQNNNHISVTARKEKKTSRGNQQQQQSGSYCMHLEFYFSLSLPSSMHNCETHWWMAIRLTFRVTPPINRVPLFRHFRVLVWLAFYFFLLRSHLGGVAVTCREANLVCGLTGVKEKKKSSRRFFFSFHRIQKFETLRAIRHPTVFNF